jgi:EAL domain-containing protein (putative c-di-GMP-specific phosphodiesterase class I)
LRSEGCDEVQGYLFSPALSAADAEKMIAKRRLSSRLRRAPLAMRVVA